MVFDEAPRCFDAQGHCGVFRSSVPDPRCLQLPGPSKAPGCPQTRPWEPCHGLCQHLQARRTPPIHRFQGPRANVAGRGVSHVTGFVRVDSLPWELCMLRMRIGPLPPGSFWKLPVRPTGQTRQAIHGARLASAPKLLSVTGACPQARESPLGEKCETTALLKYSVTLELGK